MIQEIYIKNFAIIEEINCQFADQMTVLTGETGAGKSIIIDAMGLLAGERASYEMIRHGAQKAIVQGLFSIEDAQLIAQLQDMGIEVDDEQIVVQRELDRNGKTTCRINGQLTTVSTLKQIGQFLIDIHGQNEHFLLLNPEKHVMLVDQFAGGALATSMVDYSESYEQYCQLQKEYTQLVKSDQQDQQRLDLLQYQLNEIESAGLVEGEFERLEEEQAYFLHYQKIQTSLGNSMQLLQLGDRSSSVIDQVGQVASLLASIEHLHTEYEKLSQQVQESYYQLQDASHTISRLMDQAEFDQERLDQIEERLALYTQLKRKYGANTVEILAYANQIRNQLEMIENRDVYLQKALAQLESVKEQCYAKAHVIRSIRQQVAQDLVQQIERELQSLYMEQTTFEIRFTKADHLMANGLDIVEFYLSTNVGEPPKPLSKIASGGELSRITLAMKTIFSQMKQETTVIFDEIDTGVSGRVAQAVAEKMRYIAQYAQVFCITHLPQVSALAQHHFLIKKEEHQGRTQTALVTLTGAQRIDEIARMIAGDTITDVSREQAKELIMKSENMRA